MQRQRVIAPGADEASDIAAEATTELDRRALELEAALPSNEGTTELDRSAFVHTAAKVLPFAPGSEPGRSSQPPVADGALPFKPRAHPTPPINPPPPPVPPPRASPPSSPHPPAFGLTRMLGAEQVRPPTPPGGGPGVSAPGELGDLFRKAFGVQQAKPSFGEAAPPLPPPPPSTPQTTSASPIGATAASDAAAVAETRASAAAIGALALERGRTIERRAVVDLLAFEPNVPSRLRRSKIYAPIVTMAASPRTAMDVDAPAGEQQQERGRVEVLRVLSCATPLGAGDLQASVDALLDDPHDYEIPLLFVEGDVRPTMDEIEALRVGAELAKALGATNKRVQGLCALATETLSRSVPPLPEAAFALYRQLEAATSELSLPARHFADLVERTLLEARSFKKRTLLGATRIRTELTLGRLVLPLYLPEAASSQLPLLPTFPLAALAEFRPREDASESNAAALVAFAFGRVLRARR